MAIKEISRRQFLESFGGLITTIALNGCLSTEAALIPEKKFTVGTVEFTLDETYSGSEKKIKTLLEQSYQYLQDLFCLEPSPAPGHDQLKVLLLKNPCPPAAFELKPDCPPHNCRYSNCGGGISEFDTQGKRNIYLPGVFSTRIIIHELSHLFTGNFLDPLAGDLFQEGITTAAEALVCQKIGLCLPENISFLQKHPVFLQQELATFYFSQPASLGPFRYAAAATAWLAVLEKKPDFFKNLAAGMIKAGGIPTEELLEQCLENRYQEFQRQHHILKKESESGIKLIFAPVSIGLPGIHYLKACLFQKVSTGNKICEVPCTDTPLKKTIEGLDHQGRVINFSKQTVSDDTCGTFGWEENEVIRNFRECDGVNIIFTDDTEQTVGEIKLDASTVKDLQAF